mmetsp:Transcript_26136/g.39710  ORF Transcript_26136/g.39710 Transcript_26136/m.39710 type:complete len:134 (+) Transcript_26136:136-537(+)
MHCIVQTAWKVDVHELRVYMYMSPRHSPAGMRQLAATGTQGARNRRESHRPHKQLPHLVTVLLADTVLLAEGRGRPVATVDLPRAETPTPPPLFAGFWAAATEWPGGGLAVLVSSEDANCSVSSQSLFPKPKR